MSNNISTNTGLSNPEYLKLAAQLLAPDPKQESYREDIPSPELTPLTQPNKSNEKKRALNQLYAKSQSEGDKFSKLLRGVKSFTKPETITLLSDPPQPPPKKDNEYPYLTDQDKQTIHDNVPSDPSACGKFGSQEALEKAMDEKFNEAKKEAALLLGKDPADIKISSFAAYEVFTDLVTEQPNDNPAQFDALRNIIKDNTKLSPEEDTYLHTQKQMYYPPFYKDGDRYGTSNDILDNLVRIIDNKNGSHMSNSDIDRLWSIYSQYVDAHPSTFQVFNHAQWCGGEDQYGVKLSAQDYQNIIAQFMGNTKSNGPA
ncbi:MAG: hypothetical protein C5B47_03265 [Verrucomicrobia bacterium]|nr:MAG: hypothetical protein C5B47_03265 [Verrucomicrobiota bacterium]